jgi:hypothetical protein
MLPSKDSSAKVERMREMVLAGYTVDDKEDKY